jgi:hypothetical protein
MKLLAWQLARYEKDYPEQYAVYQARLAKEQLDRVLRPPPVEEPGKKQKDFESARGPHYAKYRRRED